MDEQQNKETRPVNPRRRKRSRMQIFKEAYLPVIIAGAALLLILIFVIGSISRAVQKHNAEKEASLEASEQAASEAARLAKEAADLIEQAQLRADAYAYNEAIAILDSFTGNISEFEALAEKRAEYVSAQKSLNAWSDPNKILNLSYHMLIADPQRAFNDDIYGSSYNGNFVTVSEFTGMLEQLYANNYVLVSLDDFIDAESTDGITSKVLYLPPEKKPLLLTQTGVNYYTYMTDSDGDRLPDQGADGFASKLLLDANGQLTNEYITADGKTVYGAYDLVPILEAFIAEHPDFSFNGARAILAVTAYDGLFGYRTNPSEKERLGDEAYQQELADATTLIGTLRGKGYDIACYTYDNVEYGQKSVTEIQADLSSWQTETQDILGQTDILVYARTSDIAEKGPYSGEKFDTLHAAGFRYYLGFCEDGQTWAHFDSNYMRQGRILVTGTNITEHEDWFSGIFDTASLLDSARSN